MRASNLENRVVALEQCSSSAAGVAMVVGPYAEGDDRAPHFEAALQRWVQRFGSPPPEGARVLDIILVGVMAEDDHHAAR